jgi:hypothetical protein
VPFALFSGRIRFAAIYSLVAGVFLVLYYQLPTVNGFNVENLGAYALLRPFGDWSPPLPDVRARAIARFLGNYAIPLSGFAMFVLEFVRTFRERGRRPEIADPGAVRRYTVPALVLAAVVGAATIWSATRPKIRDLRFIETIERKIDLYDVVRYRGPAPLGRGKIWVARTLRQPGTGNALMNIATAGGVSVLVWCVVAFHLGQRERE